METTIPTGRIIPRDYGLQIRIKGAKPIFVSPARYSLATMLLEPEERIIERLQEFAERKAVDFDTVYDRFTIGLRRRLGEGLMEAGDRDVMQNVRVYGEQNRGRAHYTANVLSKAGDESYAVQLAALKEGSFRHVDPRCECQDKFWTDVKSLDAFCIHATALELAIAKDLHSRLSSADNLTGLTRSKLLGSAQPFNLSDKLINDVVAGYFAGRDGIGKRINQYSLSRSALDQIGVCSPELEKAILSGEAQYTVLTQKPEEKDKTQLSTTEIKFFGAVRALEQRIIGELRNSDYSFDGYGLEFKDSSHEVIGLRFKKGDVVYTVCTKKGEAPLLVRKILGRPYSDLTSTKDSGVGHPMTREVYKSIDAATRREAEVKIIVPANEPRIYVPQILQQAYGKRS